MEGTNVETVETLENGDFNVYIPENETSTKLHIVLNNKEGSLKLAEDGEYTKYEITRTVEFEEVANKTITVNIMAEDGTQKTVNITVIAIE